MAAKLNVPSLNVQKFMHGDDTDKKDFSDQLGKAFLDFGFAKIRGHAVHAAVIDRYYELSNQFFALPDSIKKKYEIKKMAGQRGYTSFGREHAKGSKHPDLKEFFQIGQEITAEGADQGIFLPNVYVDEIPDFTEVGIQLYQQFETMGTVLLQAIADFLELNTHYFDEKVIHGNSILRAIYYPPITREPASSIRAESHEDINLITLLVGASAGGLQLFTKNEQWLDITPAEDEIVINVGDMLQRLTNGYLPSTTHRVVNPPREKWHEPRLSIPFFMHPQPDMDLTCLETCVSEDRPAQYPPITSYEYLQERLQEIGLKDE